MIKKIHFTQLLRAPARQYGGEGGEAALFAPLGRKLLKFLADILALTQIISSLIL